MYNDIEQVINDNLTLKKAYQVAKNHSDNLSTENKQLNEKYKELRQSLEIITDQNNKLHERNKSLLAQINNINASFISQIEQLKSLIQQKENQLQNFQLKLIPSLDQDMIRVKLIAEMEGPYQQQVDKKDRDISKLKDQIHELKRQKQIIQFSLNNKQRDLKKQIQQLRNYYISEIDRLTRQIAHMSQKSSTGKTQKQILKSYRLEIDQLRSTCQFHKGIQQQLRKQLAVLRVEREKLLAELANKNAQKAIQLRQNTNDGQIKDLKLNIIRLEDQLQRIRQQLQRSKTKIKSLQTEKKKSQNQYENQIRDMKINWEKERQGYRNQIMDYKEQVRRFRQQSKRSEDQLHELRKKYQSAVSLQERLTQENASLRLRINAFEATQYESHRDKRERIQRQIRQKIERQLTIKIREQIMSELNKKKQPWTPKKQDPPKQDPRPTPKPNPYRRDPYSPNRQQNLDPNTKEKTIRILEQKLKKLTMKLEFANRKILELIREKAQRSDKITIQERRNRSISSPQHDYNAILLQHRDSSFIPLCPPVIMQQIDHHRFIDPFRPF